MMTKSIRVSNFNHKQLEKILNKLGLKHKPVCNQVECHPYLNQSKLLEFCKSKDILLVADTSLGSDLRKKWVKKENPVLLQDPVLNAVAEKHWRTPAQVALCYQLQQGVVALAKNFNEKRIKENFQVFEFQLTPKDMGCLDGLNRNIHYFDHDLLIIQITHFMRNINNCVCGCSRVLALVLMIKAHLKDEKVPALLDIT